MQTRAQVLPEFVEAAPVSGPLPYWGLALLVACTASWLGVFAVAKLFLALIHG